MSKKIFNKSSGKVSSILLMLGVLLIVVIVVIFIVISANSKNGATSNDNIQTNNEPPKPVYETTIGDVKFTLQSAEDLGNVIEATKGGFTQKITTTEKFIKVTIGAQNKGKLSTQRGMWNVGNIVDSEGRNFISINERAYFFLPYPSLCTEVLKPEFEPTPCIKLYEVSKASTGLKVQVYNTLAKKDAYLDLDIK